MEWNDDMDAAPKDGTRILLASQYGDGPGRVMLGYWEPNDDPEDSDGWFTDSEWWPEEDFTHWMPLPEPPNKVAQPPSPHHQQGVG